MPDFEDLSDLPPLDEPDDDGRWGNPAGEPAAPPAGFTARPFVWRDPSTIPLRQWVLERHLIRQYIAVMASPGGFGKSSVVILDALALVTGRNLIGHQPHGRYRVLIWNGEDPLEEMERRVMAACIHYGIGREEIEGRLFLNSGRDDPITVATVERGAIKIAVPTVEAFKAEIRRHKIDCWFIDPFVSCHAVPENDNMMIDRVAKLWGGIAGATDSAGELVHHTKKTGGNEVTMEDMRGAVALLSAARSGRILNGMSKDEAERAGVADRRLHFRIDNGKANLAPPPSDGSNWFKMQSVALMNGGSLNSRVPLEGDSVGVVTAWQWPDPLATISVADLRAAQTAVRAGGPWRESIQAKDWVGIPIARAMRLNPDDKADREKVKRALKVWIENGMFVVVMGLNEKRRPTPMIEVGTLATD